MVRTRVSLSLAIAALWCGQAGIAQVTNAGVTADRILHAANEPQNWLTYSGGYAGQRYSGLTKLTRENVRDLELKWVYHPKYLDKMEATPLVVDGVLYTAQNSEVVALDAATGRNFWTFHYAVPPESNGYLMVIKGLAIAGDRLFWATIRRASDRHRCQNRPGYLEQDDRGLAQGISSSTWRRLS